MKKEGLSITIKDIPIDENSFQETIIHSEHEIVVQKNDCLHITIPKGKEGHISLTTTYDKNNFTKIIIIAEEQSHLTINRNIIEKGNKKNIREQIHITAEKNAIITYNEHQSLQQSNWESKREGTVKENAMINWYTHSTGGSITHQHTITKLVEPFAKTILLATNHINEQQEQYLTSTNLHEAPETESGMYGKSVVTGKALHKGLIIIGKNASNAKGFQREDIILEKEGVADALPELEINNQNVECSHGATVGQLDEEQLFYLRTHGLTEETAKKVITQGFLTSIIEYANNDWEHIILSMQKKQHGEKV